MSSSSKHGDVDAGMVGLARLLSVVFHPFVMVAALVGVAAAARQPAGQAMRTIALVVGFTVLPISVLMIRNVRRGMWESADASRRHERRTLYLVTGVGLITLLAYVAIAGERQLFLVRGVAATLAMLLVCGAMMRWTKVSLHMAFASLAATALGLMRSPVGYLLLIALPALAWSRLSLERHTPGEVAIGAIIGVAAGVGIHYL
jgi:hypothetical protein